MPQLTQAQKAVELVRAAADAVKRAAAAEGELARVKAASESLIPHVVEAMVAGERIRNTPDERAKLAQLLADPVERLHLIADVAKHRAPAEDAHTLGRGDGPAKQASRRDDVTDAERSLFNAFGIQLRG